ncbi:hypothetical protein EFD56_17690, partial [Rhizobium phaseoli]
PQMASEALPPTHYDLSTINPVHSVRDLPGLYLGVAPHPNPLPVNGARGRALREVVGDGEVEAILLRPACGRRCRQADEGLLAPIS